MGARAPRCRRDRVEAPASWPSGRERILDTAYELFSKHGTRAVGVDRIIAEAGAAKMTLYRNFASKDELIVAFLARARSAGRAAGCRPRSSAGRTRRAGRLLAIFDVFGEWFALPDFEGCSFINVMLELTDRDDPGRVASVQHLSVIREFLAGLAEEAGVADPEAFARQWHILMKGSIVAAAEGDAQAAARAQELGALLLAARLA